MLRTINYRYLNYSNFNLILRLIRCIESIKYWIKLWLLIWYLNVIYLEQNYINFKYSFWEFDRFIQQQSDVTRPPPYFRVRLRLVASYIHPHPSDRSRFSSVRFRRVASESRCFFPPPLFVPLSLRFYKRASARAPVVIYKWPSWCTLERERW